jgi:hypothetical protein
MGNQPHEESASSKRDLKGTMQNDLDCLQAVQTEYKGVVFRSKSEAILARNFDLNNAFWIYEPKGLTQGDLWIPDFWLIWPKQITGFWSIILEYKPRTPTDTFKKRLAERFCEVKKTMPHSGMLLFVGDAFQEDSKKYVEEWASWLPGDGWGMWSNCEFMSKLEEARTFRFDLQ